MSNSRPQPKHLVFGPDARVRFHSTVRQSSKLLALPDELLLAIALHAGSTSERSTRPSGLYSLALTCRKLRPISREALLRTAVIKISKVPQYCKAVHQERKIAGRITHLTLDGWRGWDADIALTLKSRKPLCDVYDTKTLYGFSTAEWKRAFPTACSEQWIAALLVLLPNLKGLTLEGNHCNQIPGLGLIIVPRSRSHDIDYMLSGAPRVVDIMEKLLYNRLEVLNFIVPTTPPKYQGSRHRILRDITDYHNAKSPEDLHRFSRLREVSQPSSQMHTEYAWDQSYPSTLQTLQITNLDDWPISHLSRLRSSKGLTSLHTVRFLFSRPARHWLADKTDDFTSWFRANSFLTLFEEAEARNITIKTYFRALDDYDLFFHGCADLDPESSRVRYEKVDIKSIVEAFETGDKIHTTKELMMVFLDNGGSGESIFLQHEPAKPKPTPTSDTLQPLDAYSQPGRGSEFARMMRLGGGNFIPASFTTF